MATVDRDQLLASAKYFAERALSAYLENDTRVILVYAAFSMEHLSKTYLCDLHPALLAEFRNGQVDALLHLVDLGGPKDDQRKGSVGASRARTSDTDGAPRTLARACRSA